MERETASTRRDVMDMLQQLRDKARRRHRSAGQGMRREHLAKLAEELGFEGWSHLVAVLKGHETARFGSLFYAPACGAHFNIWSAAYDEAKQIRDEHGGWLLPYKHQFIIVDRYFIETLGLDPDAADWAEMGRDWVAAKSPSARQRLCERVVRARAATLD
jgi:hypothetical protein